MAEASPRLSYRQMAFFTTSASTFIQQRTRNRAQKAAAVHRVRGISRNWERRSSPNTTASSAINQVVETRSQVTPQHRMYSPILQRARAMRSRVWQQRRL